MNTPAQNSGSTFVEMILVLIFGSVVIGIPLFFLYLAFISMKNDELGSIDESNKIPKIKNEVFCYFCEAQLDISQIFCSNCGHRIQ